MATVFRSAGFARETEAQIVQGMPESNGLPAFITGIETMPGPYRFAARDLRAGTERSQGRNTTHLLAEAKADGPAAAAEAETTDSATGSL